MALRAEPEKFPYNNRTKGVWYILIDWKNKSQIGYSNVSDKNDLVSDLNDIIENDSIHDYQILGVWQGNYSTDIFELSIIESYRELSTFFNNEG